jgi:uncharacterized DUF497 family protein
LTVSSGTCTTSDTSLVTASQPQEVEDAVCGAHVVVPAKAWHRARSAGSCSAGPKAGRYLVVVFTIRRTRLRPVTAYTMNQAERGIYGSQID